MKLVDDDGRELPRDGQGRGRAQGQGTVDLQGLLRDRRNGCARCEGWFATGDHRRRSIPNGYLQITDRAKDVIKSGGEWVSSVDLRELRMRASRRADGPPRSACVIRNGKSDRCCSSCRDRAATPARDSVLAHLAATLREVAVAGRRAAGSMRSR
jgi:fatty-acyl-CoA synthase